MVLPVPAPAAEPRRTALLEAALGVFARFGYRKTSMDEVARAAQISRQGLYLHFANKEELFRATVQQAVEDAHVGQAMPWRPMPRCNSGWRARSTSGSAAISAGLRPMRRT
ncbi:MAG: helix-turn-helix domain-containing protein [Lacunisphaera sp.]